MGAAAPFESPEPHMSRGGDGTPIEITAPVGWTVDGTLHFTRGRLVGIGSGLACVREFVPTETALCGAPTAGGQVSPIRHRPGAEPRWTARCGGCVDIVRAELA
jgi:hypothetical protein